jgi:hypothetical protein
MKIEFRGLGKLAQPACPGSKRFSVRIRGPRPSFRDVKESGLSYLLRKQGHAGSNPAVPTKFFDMFQADVVQW